MDRKAIQQILDDIREARHLALVKRRLWPPADPIDDMVRRLDETAAKVRQLQIIKVDQ